MYQFIADAIGPRVVGGQYRSGYWHKDYTVISIDVRDHDAMWSMTVEWADGKITTHCTAWEPKRDKIITTIDHPTPEA